MLETAWQLGASDDRLPLTIAGIWQSLGDERQVLAWMERARAVAPDNDPTRNLQLGQMLLKNGELDRAAEIANALTNSASPSIKSQAHILLGHIATARGQIDEAVAHWKHSAEAGDASPELLAVLGAHYFNAGDHKTAATVLRRVVDGKSPRDPSAKHDSSGDEQVLRFLIVSLIHSGESTAAHEYLRQYIEQHGLNKEAKTLARSLATATKTQ
jgi:tetratricopeptide (TPR) repeat protein